MTELLKFNEVVAGYGQARILHGVDLAVESNERVAILGRNGVGKTTVVNTFLSSARLMQGTVELAGQRIRQLRYFTAARLGISTHTAKFHVASILAKLGAGSRTEAVTMGMRRGLVVI